MSLTDTKKENNSVLALSPKRDIHLEVEYLQLIDSYKQIRLQVSNGIYSVHRVASYLRKICTAKQQYSKRVIELSNKYANDKSRKEYQDKMLRCLTGLQEIQQTMSEIAMQEQLFCNLVTSELVTKITEWLKSLESRFNEIVLEEQKRSAKIKAAQTNVRQTRQYCQRLIASMLKEKKETDWTNNNENRVNEKELPKPPPEKSKESLMSRVASTVTILTGGSDIRDKAFLAARNYQHLIDEVNLKQTIFYGTEFPKILDKLQKLEIERLTKMKIFMNEFAIIHRQLVYPTDTQAKMMVQYCNQMDPQKDIENFIDNIVSIKGQQWSMPEMYSYDLALTPENIENNELHCHIVFGITIEELMQKQCTSHPNAKMPLVVPALCKAIKDAGGLEKKTNLPRRFFIWSM